MNYADKLERYVTSYNTKLVSEDGGGAFGKKIIVTKNIQTTCGRQEYKPSSEDFWFWINAYDPKEDGLELVGKSFVPAGYNVWKFNRFPNRPYYFRYRDWTGYFTIHGDVVDNNQIIMCSNIIQKVNNRFNKKTYDIEKFIS